MKDHSPRHSTEPCDHGSEAAIPENVANWKQVAKILHEALPQIDEALAQANVPITDRRLRAFNIVQDTMLEVSDTKAFLLSEAHGRFHVIIGDWYNHRYGEVGDDGDAFASAILIHGTPIAFRVPSRFKISADEPDMIWIGFPASVQKEETP